MRGKVGGIILFWVGSALMVILGWLYSWWIVPNVTEIGTSAISGFIGTLWGMAVPLGGLIAVLGAAAYSRGNRALVIITPIAVVMLLFLLRSLTSFDSVPSPIFGIGGGLIILSFMSIVWNWIKTRSILSKGERLGADLKILGYLFFLFTAWFLCGLLGAPNFILRPELNSQYSSIESAVNMAVYNVFIPFVVGWILVSVGHLISEKSIRAK